MSVALPAPPRRDERRPLPPEDFDYRFYQSAHPVMTQPHLQGDEEIDLFLLTEGVERIRFRRPDNALYARFAFTDGREVFARLNFDWLHMDLRGDVPWRVEMSWRGRQFEHRRQLAVARASDGRLCEESQG